jgi:hypothetical protein
MQAALAIERFQPQKNRPTGECALIGVERRVADRGAQAISCAKVLSLPSFTPIVGGLTPRALTRANHQIPVFFRGDVCGSPALTPQKWRTYYPPPSRSQDAGGGEFLARGWLLEGCSPRKNRPEAKPQ